MRRKKKRVRKRQSAEGDEREALQAALDPSGAAAKRREARKVEEKLAEAKRKGTVLSGSPGGKGKGGEPGSGGKHSGSEFTKSAKFFANMQSSAVAAAAGKGAGSKRSRDVDGGDAPNKAFKYKL